MIFFANVIPPAGGFFCQFSFFIIFFQLKTGSRKEIRAAASQKTDTGVKS